MATIGEILPPNGDAEERRAATYIITRHPLAVAGGLVAIGVLLVMAFPWIGTAALAKVGFKADAGAATVSLPVAEGQRAQLSTRLEKIELNAENEKKIADLRWEGVGKRMDNFEGLQKEALIELKEINRSLREKR